jgi:hypothetical protein
MESPDREWLKTPEGRAWLWSDEGVEWERSEEGWAWMHSPDGRAWMDELVQGGFERFFSGDMPPPPDWAITPVTAPQIGDRVRLVEADETIGGAAFSEGELMIVSELRLAPFGGVWVHLRTVDGRTMMTGTEGAFVPATS